MKSLLPSVFFAMGLLIFTQPVKSQNCDDALATLNILYLAGVFDSNERAGFFPSNEYGLNEWMLDNLEIHTAEMKVGEYEIRKINEKDILFYKNNDGEIQPFDIIVTAPEYYLISPVYKEDVCEYKANTMLFIPQKKYLKYVESWFSFSLRKDLAKKLDRELNIQINPKDYRRFCQLLHDLQSQSS